MRLVYWAKVGFATLKVLGQIDHPHEVEIGQFSTEPTRSQPSSHYFPIHEVLRIPADLDRLCRSFEDMRHLRLFIFGKAIF